MGLFNTVTAKVDCPRCRNPFEAEIQFFFGDLWNHRYAVGDEIHLGDGQDWASQRRVVAKGTARSCPSCKTRYLEFDVVIDKAVITAIEWHESTRIYPLEQPYVTESGDPTGRNSGGR